MLSYAVCTMYLLRSMNPLYYLKRERDRTSTKISDGTKICETPPKKATTRKLFMFNNIIEEDEQKNNSDNN